MSIQMVDLEVTTIVEVITEEAGVVEAEAEVTAVEEEVPVPVVVGEATGVEIVTIGMIVKAVNQVFVVTEVVVVVVDEGPEETAEKAEEAGAEPEVNVVVVIGTGLHSETEEDPIETIVVECALNAGAEPEVVVHLIEADFLVKIIITTMIIIKIKTELMATRRRLPPEPEVI